MHGESYAQSTEGSGKVPEQRNLLNARVPMTSATQRPSQKPLWGLHHCPTATFPFWGLGVSPHREYSLCLVLYGQMTPVWLVFTFIRSNNATNLPRESGDSVCRVLPVGMERSWRMNAGLRKIQSAQKQKSPPPPPPVPLQSAHTAVSPLYTVSSGRPPFFLSPLPSAGHRVSGSKCLLNTPKWKGGRKGAGT